MEFAGCSLREPFARTTLFPFLVAAFTLAFAFALSFAFGFSFAFGEGVGSGVDRLLIVSLNIISIPSIVVVLNIVLSIGCWDSRVRIWFLILRVSHSCFGVVHEFARIAVATGDCLLPLVAYLRLTLILLESGAASKGEIVFSNSSREGRRSRTPLALAWFSNTTGGSGPRANILPFWCSRS